MEPDVSPFAPATAGPAWKDTVGRTAKDGETFSRSGTCRGMPRCFGVPKLRHGTARAGRRLSAFASPYLVMQSGLGHRHSADSGWESRPGEHIKGIACWRLSHEKSPCPVITTMQRERLKYELWLSRFVGDFEFGSRYLRPFRLFQALVNPPLQLLALLFEPCQFI